jgi:acyl-CoA thioesterase FadM
VEIAQTFEARYRVRFDEADSTGHLRPSGFLRYAQDLAWLHSEAAGFDRAWYEERGTFWVVRIASLRLLRPVRYGDQLDGTTRVVGWRRVWARRHAEFQLTDGTVAAVADTDWVLLTLEGRPTRIPDEISRHFAPGSNYRPEKVEVDATPDDAFVSLVQVRPADVDPLGHLNNAAYLDLIDEALQPLGRVSSGPSSYQVEFLRPAMRGSSLRIAAWRARGGALGVRMTDRAGIEAARALVS